MDRELYCRKCKSDTTMKFDMHNTNYICQKCDMFLMGSNGYEIFECDTYDFPQLFVTKEIFIYLNQIKFFKVLMKIYIGRIRISTEEEID